MRWTRNDSLAYDTFSKAADDVKEWNTERELAKAYGLQPEQVHTTGYDIGDDPTGIQSTQYRIGGRTQATPFTQDEIDRARMEAVTNTYGRLGKPGEALKMRAAGVQLDAARQGLKKGKLELDTLEDEARQRTAANDAFSVYQKALAGDKDATTKLVQLGVAGYNRNPDGTEYADGRTAFFDAETGRLHIADTSGAAQTLSLDQMDPAKRQALLQHGFRAHLATVSPRMFAEVSKMNAQDQELFFKGMSARAAQQNAETNERYRGDMVGLSRRREDREDREFAAREKGGMYRRPDPGQGLGQPIGLSDDGTQLLFASPRGGLRAIPVPEGFSKLFPKTTGERPGRPQLTPEQDREYRKQLIELGRRPADSKRAAEWDAQKEHIDAVFGVSSPSGQPSVEEIADALRRRLGQQQSSGAPLAPARDYTTPTPQQGLRPPPVQAGSVPLGFRVPINGGNEFFNNWVANRPLR